MVVDPVAMALQYVWRTLTPLQVPMAVVGGLAMAHWRYWRATLDVDVMLAVDRQHELQVIEALLAAHCRPKTNLEVKSLGGVRFLQLQYEPPDSAVDVQIDLLIADSSFHAQVLTRSMPTTIKGTEVQVAACEDLILLKLLAGRIIDRVDVIALLKRNVKELDVAHLLRWGKILDVMAPLRAAWSEALPDVSFPDRS